MGTVTVNTLNTTHEGVLLAEGGHRGRDARRRRRGLENNKPELLL